MSFEVLQGDCIERMAEMEEASVDAVVCDPPYGIGFMGREWDVFAPEAVAKREAQRERKGTKRHSARHPDRVGSVQGGGPAIQYDESLSGNQRFQAWMTNWAGEVLRVLKPGGHLLAFGGTRTYHRLACAIEDAGFEIRDSLLWLYGSGFPKSLDVAKAIDKAKGVEGAWRQEDHPGRSGVRKRTDSTSNFGQTDYGEEGNERHVYEAGSEEAQSWQGWGTALKPSHEPIVVARKPLVGTVAANVLEHGTGALNVDGCRVGTTKRVPGGISQEKPNAQVYGTYGIETGDESGHDPNVGRWPANVVLSHTPLCEPVGTRIVKSGNHGSAPGGFGAAQLYGDGDRNLDVSGGYGEEMVTEWDCAPGCPVAALNAQSGELKSGFMAAGTQREGIGYRGGPGNRVANDTPGDSGGASRFFDCAKTSRAERNAGLEGFEEKEPPGSKRSEPAPGRKAALGAPRANHHPTVKPIDLMRWLVRLVTPPGGTCLDPFLGSGSTGCAAVLEGFDFIGIEREADYVAIAEARIKWWAEHRGREAEEVLADHGRSEREVAKHRESGQLGLELA